MEFFLIIKKKTGKKDFAFVRDVGIEFKDIFKTIILKNIKKWNSKQKELQYLKERKICRI